MVAHVEQLFAKASASHEARLWTEAEALYRSILEEEPGHAASLHRLGLLAHRDGQLERAVSLIQDAISFQPGEAAFHSSLGAVLLAAKRQAEALDSFERAVALDPGSAMGRNNFAYVLHTLGFPARAIAEYEQAVKIAPDSAEIWNNFAQVLMSQGAFDRAIESLRKSIALGTRDAEVHANLARALCVKGAFAEALEAATSGLRINPNSAFGHFNLGNALGGLKRFTEAVAAYRNAAVGAPNNADIHRNLALALDHLNERDAARSSFETAGRLAPNDRYLNVMARTYGPLHQMQLGWEALSQMLETPPDRDMLHGVGDELNARGFHTVGLETISKGAGTLRLSLVPPEAGETSAQRIDIDRPATPNFVGCWMMPNPEICDRLIAFFESNPPRQTPGRTGAGLDSAVKRSTDISIAPYSLVQGEFDAVNAYVRDLETCLQDYGRQWPHLSEILPDIEMGPFNLQRYQEGGHFQHCHNERSSFRHIHRVLAWMTYLNDVEEGGETVFPHLDLAIKPQRGKTLIWPAEWTHAHRGDPVVGGTKYIITGWFHFPHPREPDLLSAVLR